MLFKNYHYFMTIVEEGGLSKAAEKLYVSQPSLSKFIQRLEKESGIDLFDHSSSPLKLTYAGEHYYEYVKKAETLEKNLFSEIDEIKNGERGEIRLGLAPWRSSTLLPEILPAFSAQYPNIKVTVIEGKSSFLEHELLKKRLDFCVINLIDNLKYSHLNHDVLFEEEILLAGNTNNISICNATEHTPHSKYPFLDLSYLVNETFIMTKSGQKLTNMGYQLFSKKNFQPKKILEIENVTTAINLVAANMGFAFIPAAGAEPELLPPGISLFSTDSPPLKWSFAIVRRKDSYETKCAALFAKALKNYYQDF